MRMIDKFEKLPLNYYDKTKIGESINILVSSSSDVSSNLSVAVSNLIKGTIFLVGILVGMFYLS
jgi:ABC-type multidrug transport system fused ATPase/permease subunit